MQNNYRVEVNRWTWVGIASGLIFVTILVFQLISWKTSPLEKEMIILEQTYPMTEGYSDLQGPPAGTEATEEHVEPIDPVKVIPDGSETYYDPYLVSIWVTGENTNVSERIDFQQAYKPELYEERVTEAFVPIQTSTERILELISEILDKLVQIITGATTLFAIYKSIKRKDVCPA